MIAPAALRPLRIRRPPQLEPPYDAPATDLPDDRRGLRLVGTGPHRTANGSRAAGREDQLPFDRPAGRRPPAGTGGGRSADGVARLRGYDALVERTPRVALPDPRAFAGRFVDATLEVLAGSRPLTQLMPLTNEIVYAQLGAMVRRRGRYGTVARRVSTGPLRRPRLLISEPADGVAEITAIIRQQDRARAIAARLEGLDGRWRCTAWELV
jgi:hypothetical protein